MTSKKGFTLIELMIVVGLIGLLITGLLTFQRTFLKYQVVSQQLTDLQLLGRISLEQMKREIRQAMKIGNLPEYQNYRLGVSSMSITVPNLNFPYDRQLADIVWYSTGSYRGNPNRLLQRVDQTNSGGGLSPWIPVVVNIDEYRKNPGSSSVTASGVEKLFEVPNYQYDNVTVYWNQARNSLAIGLVLSARKGEIITRLPLTAVVTLRKQ
ncbi:MAG: prepilin-type N-terminal cleavage/methylation domain-containing protein [Elusimicrobiota bacterium]